jgi:heat-inducible transcriptional repressor
MKPLALKKPTKDERERLILFGLVDLYLQSGKPIGSNTLRENGFEALSSATIRNYFAKLEEEGLVKQQHSSGGRIPTATAYKIYAEAHFDRPRITAEENKRHHGMRRLSLDTPLRSGFHPGDQTRSH